MTINEELSLINTYSRKELKEDEVYIFTLTLCDNEIDRDFERFSLSSLNKLKELFKGKTGITDHSMRSKDQSARIFHTYIETDSAKITDSGEPYTALKARAYMLKTEGKLIDRQLERAAITTISGFAKISQDASKLLTV